MIDPPAISVVIPAYNAERFLPDSIGSVLSQTWRDFECIVVDDGSTDRTAAVARSFEDDRVRLVSKVNRGTVADARNAGIDAARAPWVAFLDADDAWLPEKLALQLELIAERPDAVLVYSAYAIVDDDLRVQTVIRPDHDDPAFRRWLLLEGNGIAPSSTSVMRRSALHDAGGFRLELSVSEDVDLAERVARLGGVVATDRCLALYRTHPGQGHKSLDRFSHDARWIFDDRFGAGGERDRRAWRRGMGNLVTRLVFYELASRRPGRAARHLLELGRTNPARLVLLPLEAAVRRARRRRRLQTLGAGLDAEIAAARAQWSSVPRRAEVPTDE